MTKYKKHKKTNKRSQRGGDLTSWFTGTSSNGAGYGESYSSKAKKAYDDSMASLGSWFGSTPSSSSSSSYTPASTAPMTPTMRPDTTGLARGGRKRRKMRGGKGGLGLTYYASPVLKSEVVEPNEWLLYNNRANQQGGSRKRKCKTRKCKTRKCKTRKH